MDLQLRGCRGRERKGWEGPRDALDLTRKWIPKQLRSVSVIVIWALFFCPTIIWGGCVRAIQLVPMVDGLQGAYFLARRFASQIPQIISPHFVFVGMQFCPLLVFPKTSGSVTKECKSSRCWCLMSATTRVSVTKKQLSATQVWFYV